MKIANVIIALDMKGLEKTKNFVDKFINPTWFKVGMELIYSEGFEIINYLKKKNHKVFLDLKLFDIPTTVKKSLESIANYDVDMTSIHIFGGLEMLKAAKQASTKLNILGVTILTSTNQKTLVEEMQVNHQINEQVLHLAKLAKAANLYGVVCSPNDALFLKDLGLKLITPGIRRIEDAPNDQKRFTTPQESKKNGADYIVVGRPITQVDNPVEVYNNFVKEFSNG